MPRPCAIGCSHIPGFGPIAVSKRVLYTGRCCHSTGNPQVKRSTSSWLSGPRTITSTPAPGNASSPCSTCAVAASPAIGRAGQSGCAFTGESACSSRTTSATSSHVTTVNLLHTTNPYSKGFRQTTGTTPNSSLNCCASPNVSYCMSMNTIPCPCFFLGSAPPPSTFQLYVFAIRIKKGPGISFTLYDFRDSYNLAHVFERFFIRFRVPYKKREPCRAPVLRALLKGVGEAEASRWGTASPINAAAACATATSLPYPSCQPR